jgi:hypothetical protein
MPRRHSKHDELLSAVDKVLGTGNKRDWADLRQAARRELSGADGKEPAGKRHPKAKQRRYTAAEIDEVIRRGKRRHWAELQLAALADRALLEAVLGVCNGHREDPEDQRYRFWKRYAERHLG